MTPTMKLRFVERTEKVFDHDLYGNIVYIKRVLQQWWEKRIWAHDAEIVVASEWRDVPLGVE